MEIVIHGTKDGSQTLFYTNYELSRVIVNDIRSGSNNDKPLGKSAYSIALLQNGIVFSKYQIIKDTLRSYATGTIAVSLFLKYNEIMAGEDIKDVIDRLLLTYEKKYIVNNLMNRGEAQLIREDFSFVKEIQELSNVKLDTDEDFENKRQGTNAAAIIYYALEKELHDYFEEARQEQYGNYSQILFVDKTFEGKEENPLLILKHDPLANLTGKIDLTIKKYKLYNFNGKGNNGCTIEIRANGKLLYDKDNISNKDTISIKYCKNNCYKDIPASGRINEGVLKQYLKIDQQNKKVEVIKEVDFEPIQKTILFEIKKSNGEIIKDGEVKIGMDILLSVNERYQKLFIGEQLKERYTIKAIKEGFIGEKEFVPLEIKENEIVELVLNERKVIKIIVKDETGTELKDFDVCTNITKGFIRTSQLEFVDDEIRGIYNITIRKNDYTEETINNFEPSKSQKETTIRLNKKITNIHPQEKYKVKAGKFGKFVDNNSYWSYRKDGSDVKHMIKAIKGYEFTHFEFDKGTDTLTAQYKKKKSFIQKPILIFSTLFMLLIVGFGVWYFLENEEQSSPSKVDIPAPVSDTNNIKVDNDSATKKDTKTPEETGKPNEKKEDNDIKEQKKSVVTPKKIEPIPDDTSKKATKSNTTTTTNSKQVVKKENQLNNLESEFFTLVRSGNINIEDYKKLSKKFQSQKGEVIDFLRKICNDIIFGKFKNISATDRRSAKTIAELEKYLKG